ncbi:hypothetical protein B0H66DRAFT_52466 [Apodospora peruviana]|uniref:LIM zinc-binding domain-containing protein n=1 Tax=Apodospora peruviana TaxID=516989 RepID=A0AAE0IS18_9PEZI|nr:hypothetical protein B0H66DRAFT_52466 [Apodospora peruviana]
MFARGKSKERSSSSTRKVTPPSPSYMSSEQFAQYLTDLRNTRINRSGGARPQPALMSSQDSAAMTTTGRSSFGTPPLSDTSSINHQSAHSDATPNVASSSAGRPSMSASVSSRYSTMSRGRDYYPDRPVQPLKPSEIVPSATYIERGQRWMEKEEAVSLRQAMEDMDLKDQPKHDQDATDPESREEKRIHEAALEEAAKLVWQHQNPGKVPQPGAPYRYKSHLRKNSYAHARTASAGLYGSDVAPSGLARDPSSRSVSGSSTDSDGFGSTRSRSSFASSRHAPCKVPEAGRGSFDRSRAPLAEPRNPKSYGFISGGTSVAVQQKRRRSSMKRNISGEIEKPFLGDQIWEEPDNRTSRNSEDSTAPTGTVQTLRTKPKNPLNRVQFAPDVPAPADATPPPPPPKVVSKYEIYRNPPTQSRNPLYTTNQRSVSPVEREPDVPRKHGMEVRSEDIRQATSMRLNDRSPKLPTPSAVSDNPGRPIVSFDKNWKPAEEATDNAPEESIFGCRGADRSSAPIVPTISVSDDFSIPSSSTISPSRHRAQPAPASIQVDGPPPPIPTIAVSDATSPSIPTIGLPGDEPDNVGNSSSIPVILTPDDGSSSGSGSRRPLPTPQPGGSRVRHQQAARPRGHWSPAQPPAGSRATARCHECGYSIEGRFVSLAGTSERFHPHCFACYTCGTSLEALEISTEPDAHRAARLDRIARRAAGEVLPEQPGETMAEDGDERLRLYCHLDWHELFAPRCKHCKTPIMGEHVVALGAHWHFGHFFCAECGDPFERGMTHIEKDGYAWCVSCQTKRTERRAPKCRRCKKAVIGQYVQALGGEWHDKCFRCNTCGGGFDDGQIFPWDGKRQGAAGGAPGGEASIVLCTRCMEKELKA